MEKIEIIIKRKIDRFFKKEFNLSVSSEVTFSQKKQFGDFTTNIALIVSKDLSLSPMEIAEKIKSETEKFEFLQKVEAILPGFVNFFVKKEYFEKWILTIDAEYGKHDIGKNNMVLFEFGQPNTHKEFHVGHLRSAITGLSLSNILKNSGFDVKNVNYFGDVGMHTAKATWGFLQNEGNVDFDKMQLNEQMKFIDSCYVFGSKQFSENLKCQEEIKKINLKIYKEENSIEYKTYSKLREVSIKYQDQLFKSLGVFYDKQYPESLVWKQGLSIVSKNIENVFEQSGGAVIYRGEKEGLTNWVFITKEGNPTYSAKDLGLAFQKFQDFPEAQKSYITTSIEQKDYFKAVIKVFEKIYPEHIGKITHIPFGWVLFGGKKSSSRTGGLPKALEIFEEIQNIVDQKISISKQYSDKERAKINFTVGLAGLKFLILSHQINKNIDYNPESFLSMSGFSGPFVLYSYVRAKSILKEKKSKFNHSKITFGEEKEISLSKLLYVFEEITKKAYLELSPHIICEYLFTLAQSFNSFYDSVPVLKAETKEKKTSRFYLTEKVSEILKKGLDLLGIEVLEKM